jgi:hypothetical protein
METLPMYVYVVFTTTLLLAISIFYKAAKSSTAFILLSIGWIILQTAVGISGFYTNTSGFPPRFVLLILPPLVFITSLFITQKGKLFIDGLNLELLTILHIIRIPVEIVLFWLYTSKMVPGLMTFEGRNFDIFSGLTAPLIYYFGFVKPIIGKTFILAWNYICLGLLINIVVNAILSVPAPFQQFAFNQPNIAILYAPFNLLPAFLVPLVLFCHLAAIRQLSKKGVVHKAILFKK